MIESPKSVSFVTQEYPTGQSPEAIIVKRITDSLPAAWKVKVFVISSGPCSTPSAPALPNVELTLFSEPQCRWDSFLLRAFRYPLERLAKSESQKISHRILTETNSSDFIFVLSRSHMLDFVSRELEAAHLGKKQILNLIVSSQRGMQVHAQLLVNKNENTFHPQWEKVLERANIKDFCPREFGGEVSEMFDFDPALTKNIAFSSGLPVRTEGSHTRNKIIDWSGPSQQIIKSGIVVLSSQISLVLSPIRVTKEFAQFLASKLSLGLFRLLKFGYAVLTSIFRVLSTLRKKIVGLL